MFLWDLIVCDLFYRVLLFWLLQLGLNSSCLIWFSLNYGRESCCCGFAIENWMAWVWIYYSWVMWINLDLLSVVTKLRLFACYRIFIIGRIILSYKIDFGLLDTYMYHLTSNFPISFGPNTTVWPFNHDYSL